MDMRRKTVKGVTFLEKLKPCWYPVCSFESNLF